MLMVVCLDRKTDGTLLGDFMHSFAPAYILSPSFQALFKGQHAQAIGIKCTKLLQAMPVILLISLRITCMFFDTCVVRYILFVYGSQERE